MVNEEIINVINSGGLAIIPTDTVYGIIADATNEEAIKKVYEAKKRVYEKPLILNVSSIEMLNKCVDDISDIEMKLIKKYWPGKLTILFKKSNKLSNLINNGGEYVGIRLPDLPELVKLIDILGKPLVSTSANIADEQTITKVELLSKELLQHIDYVYDGGERLDIPSTIVRVKDGEIEFIRKGELASLIESNFKE